MPAAGNHQMDGFADLWIQPGLSGRPGIDQPADSISLEHSLQAYSRQKDHVNERVRTQAPADTTKKTKKKNKELDNKDLQPVGFAVLLYPRSMYYTAQQFLPLLLAASLYCEVFFIMEIPSFSSCKRPPDSKRIEHHNQTHGSRKRQGHQRKK